MIKAYHATDGLGGIKVEFEGSADEILREFAHIGEGIYTAARHAINYAADGYNDNDDEYDEADEYYDLEPGDHFYYNETEYVLLNVTDNGDYFAIVAEELPERPFNKDGNDGCNNWKASDLREWLNNEYYITTFKPGHLVKSISDITADNGDCAYGKTEDFVTLISCEQYRKYRRLMPRYDNWVWTLTPWHCNVGNAYYVCTVSPSGAFYSYVTAASSVGVAPACTFNHKVLNPRRQAQNGRIYLAEKE